MRLTHFKSGTTHLCAKLQFSKTGFWYSPKITIIIKKKTIMEEGLLVMFSLEKEILKLSVTPG